MDRVTLRQRPSNPVAALKDSATDAAKNMAATVVKQGIDTAGQTPKKAAAGPGKVARKSSSDASRWRC